jgi:hypothetical protein
MHNVRKKGVVLEFTFLGFEMIRLLFFLDRLMGLHGGWRLFLDGIKALFGYNRKRVWRTEEEKAEDGGYKQRR